MKKDFSDEKLDRLLEAIVKDSQMSETELDEIAASPKIWWNVQRNIREEKATRRKGWIPTFDWRIVAFASLLLVFCGALFVSLSERESFSLAELQAIDVPFVTASSINEMPNSEKLIETPQIGAQISKVLRKTGRETVSAKRQSAPSFSPKLPVSKRNSAPRSAISNETVEIKSDFIALNYSAAPESGQIVKVKVPRAMMVSLGVSDKIENGGEYVNAEVLMGDDGTARAIRFIR